MVSLLEDEPGDISEGILEAFPIFRSKLIFFLLTVLQAVLLRKLKFGRKFELMGNEVELFWYIHSYSEINILILE